MSSKQRTWAPLLALAFLFFSEGTAAAEPPAKSPKTEVMPIGDKLTNFPVGPTETTIVLDGRAISGEAAGGGMSPECLSVNLDEALKHFTYSPASSRSAEGAVQVWARVGGPDEGDSVCRSGECSGVFKIKSNEGGGLTGVDPHSYSASPGVLKLLGNSGFTLCLGLSAPAPGTISIDKLPVSYCPAKKACSESPANVAGYWKSKYSCVDSCRGPQPEKELTIYITQDPQDPSKASYMDTEGARYSGTVCGNTFTFNGGGSDWTESGEIVFESADKATKISRYSVYEDCCVGNCRDQLVRQEQPPADTAKTLR